MCNTVIKEIASRCAALKNCRVSGNTVWEQRHAEVLDYIAKNYLPSGSGIDNGTSIDIDASCGERVVLHTSYHHMNEGGMYDGWTEHRIVIKPSFIYGMDIAIGGRNRNDIKEYLHQAFSMALDQMCDVAGEIDRLLEQ